MSAHVTARIDLGALAHNVRVLKERTGGRKLMVVVKADAYGHGLVMCGQAAVNAGADYLGVALLEEAVALREGNVPGPILAWLNTSDDRFAECIARDIDLGVNSIATLKSITNAAYSVDRIARVHIKVDTGLSRNGVTLADLPELITSLSKAEAEGTVKVVGVMSHFAYADEPNNSTIADQIAEFKAAVDLLEAANFELEVKHLANSAATLALPDTYFNMVRPGVAVYGVSPGEEVGLATDFDLKPVMTLCAPIVLLKRVPAGSGVSYAHKYHTTTDTTLALIPAGYADGVPRSASNNGPVLVGGEIRKVAGRVCMDQFVLDVGDLNVSLGDEVVLFGDPERGEPSVEDWAEAAGTISYEIITRIGPRVHREFINNSW
ncbi:MAG: alanine racemase [Actinobacteria bacterium]|nr:alanine racemase [Actinomycetota bacterium]NBO34580.1 alanine racemase [Actinomycetota bacterium]